MRVNVTIIASVAFISLLLVLSLLATGSCAPSASAIEPTAQESDRPTSATTALTAVSTASEPEAKGSKTEVLQTLGRHKRCDAAPGLAGWLVRNRTVWSLENVLDGKKGDPAKGREVFARQGCSVCHTTEKGQPLKGPFMGQVGAILSPEQIAESILKPNASISQGFATVQVDTKDKKTYVGFVTAQSADSIEIRDIAGKANRITVTLATDMDLKAADSSVVTISGLIPWRTAETRLYADAMARWPITSRAWWTMPPPV